MKPPDTDTTARALGGSAEAFAAVVDAHYRSVLAIAYSHVRQWDAAEDLAQDTFLAAWKHRDSLRDPARLTAWLMQIARNLSRNWLRSKAYRAQLMERATRDAESVKAESPQAEAMVMGEQQSAINDAIASLPEPLREAVVLFYLHEQSIADTARALGISPNAAKKRTQRARSLLRERLADSWENDFCGTAQSRSTRGKAARVSALLALPPVSETLAKAATTEAATAVAAMGATTGIGVKIGLAAAASALMLAVAVPFLAPPATSEADESPVSAADVPHDDAIAAPIEEVPAAPTESASAPSAEAAPPIAEAADGERNELTGIISDRLGRPIAGARVHLLLASPEYDVPAPGAEPPVFARLSVTGADGRYRFEDVPGGIYEFVVSADGYADLRPKRIDIARIVGEMPEVLDALEGIELAVRITDAHGGPLSDAVMGFASAWWTHGEEDAGFLDGVDRRVALTGADGRGTLDMPLPPYADAFLRGSLIVRMPTGQKALFHDIPIDPSRLLSLEWPETAQLEGTVHGGAAAGARVRLTSWVECRVRRADGSTNMVTMIAGPSYVADLNANDTYRIEGIAAEAEYRLVVIGPELNNLSAIYEMPSFEPGKTARFDCTVDQPAQITGVVRGALTGSPVPLHQVMWQSLDDARLSGVTSVDDSGAYSFEIAVPAGSYSFHPFYRGMDRDPASTDAAVVLEIEPGARLTQDFVVPDPVTRTLIAVDETGMPVEGAKIIVYHENRGWSLGETYDTDENGVTTYPALAPGRVLHFRVWLGELQGRSEAFAGNPGDVFDPETVVLR